MSEQAESLHRAKLKEIGYKQPYIELMVERYRENNCYIFAEAYHQEQVDERVKRLESLLMTLREESMCSVVGDELIESVFPTPPQ